MRVIIQVYIQRLQKLLADTVVSLAFKLAPQILMKYGPLILVKWTLKTGKSQQPTLPLVKSPDISKYLSGMWFVIG